MVGWLIPTSFAIELSDPSGPTGSCSPSLFAFCQLAPGEGLAALAVKKRKNAYKDRSSLCFPSVIGRLPVFPFLLTWPSPSSAGERRRDPVALRAPARPIAR
jgi:hypothetical protein